ncbi:Cytochrome P450 [Dillenia turbinata]|uniref:Cytochrome P450 n=1 Tax=Dillenia turbinata TaxID=194707 RepID=A0AAN8VT35_9MAGN
MIKCPAIAFSITRLKVMSSVHEDAAVGTPLGKGRGKATPHFKNMSFDLLEKIQHKVLSRWLWLWKTSNKQDQLAQVVLTVPLVVSSLLWLLWIWNKLRKEKMHLPSRPRGVPIFGYLPFLGTELHHSFTQLAQSYGPIYKLWLGKKLCIVLSSPALAKEVSRDLDLTFANRDPSIAALIATNGGLDIAWSPYGPYWRNMRKIFVSEMLSNKSLDECYALRTSEVRKAIRNVYDKIGTPVEIGELVFNTEMNVIMNLMWGATLDGEKSEGTRNKFRQMVISFMHLLGKPNVSDFFPVLARFDLQGVEREMKQCVASIERVLDSVIDAHQMKKVSAKSEDAFNNRDSKDFFEFLLELRDEEHGKAALNMTEIKALLMVMLL